jgi:Radical SAM superfamily
MYVYQIEVSNLCSLRCDYCPHPKQQRRKGFMSFETFAKCVQLYRMADNRNELFLHNFGEVLLHPELCGFLRYAADLGVKCSFFTNGVDGKRQPFTRAFWQKLADHGLERVDFSSHALTVEQFREITDGVVRVGNVFDPKLVKLGTWAGQVGAAEVPTSQPCLFERRNALVVLWDGRISSCCLDVEGRRSPLWIDDLLQGTPYRFEPISLCNTCSQMRDDEEM